MQPAADSGPRWEEQRGGADCYIMFDCVLSSLITGFDYEKVDESLKADGEEVVSSTGGVAVPAR